jgi:hypothetical protein
MGSEVFNRFHQAIVNKLENKTTNKKKPPEDKTGSPSVDNRQRKDLGEDKEELHCGKLILDATVAEQAIRFPTDLGLLNEAREISEKLIDTLYPQSGLKKKPRTYRRKASKAYLALSKQR